MYENIDLSKDSNISTSHAHYRTSSILNAAQNRNRVSQAALYCTYIYVQIIMSTQYGLVTPYGDKDPC